MRAGLSRLRWGRILALSLLVPPLLLVRQGACARLPAEDASERAGPPSLALGAFHVHSEASDGRGSLEEIARAAKDAGLSFVVMTDHNVTPAPAAHRIEGVLFVFGVEISTSDGHLVALGARGTLPQGPRTGAEAVAWGEGEGAFLSLAHPVQKKNPWKDPVSGARVPGFELYSADTLFRDALARPFSRLLPAAFGWLGGRRHGVLGLLDGQPRVHAALMARQGLPVALCAHDAHGVPPYRDVFATLATALPAEALEGPPEQGATAVVEALAEGRTLCVFHALGRPDGFALEGISATREVREGARIRVRLPPSAWARARVVVEGAGRLSDDGREVVATGEGLLQIEVWSEAPGRLWGTTLKPWLVPSPVRVGR